MLIADGVRPSARAAAENEPLSMTVSSMSMWSLVSMRASCQKN